MKYGRGPGIFMVGFYGTKHEWYMFDSKKCIFVSQPVEEESNPNDIQIYIMQFIKVGEVVVNQNCT